MKHKAKYFDFKFFSNDLMASLVVFLVALPLALGIALASGAPLMSGMISGVVGGFLAGLFAGAPLQVSGPAAGLTVIVFANIQKFGFREACAITVIAGIAQISLGVFKLAKYALAVPPAVIHAMLAGIGILISFSQIQIIMGLTPLGSFYANAHQLIVNLAHPHVPSLLIGVGTFIFLHGWNKIRTPRIKQIPGSLVAIIFFTLVSMIFDMDLKRVEISGSFFDSFILPSLNLTHLGDLITAGLITAFVASAESLICAVACDKLHDGEKSNLNREIIAQGIGNSASGMLGGLPITGVIVRTAANISANAKTRLSGMLHSVWMLIFVVLLSGLLTKIPLAALAGLLVFVGVNLIKVRDIIESRKFKELNVYIATVAGVVGLNILAGIGIGLAIATANLFKTFVKPRLETSESDHETRVKIFGPLTFVSLPFIRETLTKVKHHPKMIVDVYSELIDHAGHSLLEDWRAGHERDGTHVEIHYHHKNKHHEKAVTT